MFCNKCGSQVQEGSAFCPGCGAQVAANEVNNSYYQPEVTYTNNINAAKSMNIFRIIASAVVIIAIFMPYVSAFGFSETLLDGGDGYFFLGFAIAAIIFDALKKSMPAFILSIVTLAFAIYEAINASSINSKAFGLLQYNAGFYFLIIGAIAMVVTGPIYNSISKKKYY